MRHCRGEGGSSLGFRHGLWVLAHLFEIFTPLAACVDKDGGLSCALVLSAGLFRTRAPRNVASICSALVSALLLRCFAHQTSICWCWCLISGQVAAASEEEVGTDCSRSIQSQWGVLLLYYSLFRSFLNLCGIWQLSEISSFCSLSTATCHW